MYCKVQKCTSADVVDPVCRVWHFSSRSRVCKGNNSGVPVCTNNLWCALTNFLSSEIKILAICIIINAQDHDRPIYKINGGNIWSDGSQRLPSSNDFKLHADVVGCCSLPSSLESIIITSL